MFISNYKLSMPAKKRTLTRTFIRILRGGQFGNPDMPALRIILMQSEFGLSEVGEGIEEKVLTDALGRSLMGACLVWRNDQNKFTIEPSTVQKCAVCGHLYNNDVTILKRGENPKCQNPRCGLEFKSSISPIDLEKELGNVKTKISAMIDDGQVNEFDAPAKEQELKMEFLRNRFLWINSGQYFGDRNIQDPGHLALSAFLEVIDTIARNPQSAQRLGLRFRPWNVEKMFDGVSDGDEKAAKWVKEVLPKELEKLNSYVAQGTFGAYVRKCNEGEVAASGTSAETKEDKTKDGEGPLKQGANDL